MKEELFALIQYRLKQAEDSIREAEVLLKEGMSLRSVMNRLYYAMFYAVLALLQEKQLGTSKHYGAISLFDREFIKAAYLIRICPKPCTVPLNSGRRVTTWSNRM